MQTTLCVNYTNSDYEPKCNQIYGRIAANSGILTSLLADKNLESLALYTDSSSEFDYFATQFAQPLHNKKIYPIYKGNLSELSKCDIYLRLDPMISYMAWSRSYVSPNTFSICGLIHSLPGQNIMEEMMRWFSTPLKPWDALICSSQAGKKVIEELLRQWQDYHKQYNQVVMPAKPVQLPVIPLGINLETTYLCKTNSEPYDLYNKLQIYADDFIVLFVGRLFFYDKAHPIPALLALEGLSAKLQNKRRIVFIQAGWFDNAEEEALYSKAAKNFAPNIHHIILKQCSEELKYQLYHTADVFLSLVDNIQETFGLTLLEAMACSLPLVVSDWDGYRETVRDGVEGFLIPTVLPPAGCGRDISLAFSTNSIDYATYCGLTAQMTAVDIPACIEALYQLAQSDELCNEMGAAGLRRVQNKYQWKHVIESYKLLFDELKSIRTKDQNESAITFPPRIADPYLTFAHYGTYQLTREHLVAATPYGLNRLSQLNLDPLGNFGESQRLSVPLNNEIWHLLEIKGPLSVSSVINYFAQRYPHIQTGVLMRTLVYLIKYDVIHLNRL